MKKIIFNVYRLNKDKESAWIQANPDKRYSNKPSEVYDIVQLEGWLLNPNDIEVWGDFPKERAQELYDKGIKFVAHHSLSSYGDGISKWWTCSEYSTSASMTSRNREKRYMSIFDLGVQLEIHEKELETALAKHQELVGVINQ